jgi:hypothetical protein
MARTRNTTRTKAVPSAAGAFHTTILIDGDNRWDFLNGKHVFFVFFFFYVVLVHQTILGIDYCFSASSSSRIGRNREAEVKRKVGTSPR